MESLYQLACPGNDPVRTFLPLDVDESEVWTGIPVNEGGAVLSELFKMSSEFRYFNPQAERSITYHSISRMLYNPSNRATF